MFYIAVLSESALCSIGGYWMDVNGIRYGDETNQYINIYEYLILYYTRSVPPYMFLPHLWLS
jgi:hypothetical protein